MRRVAGLQTCFALVLAFFLAPFEHVHSGQPSGTDDDHSGTIHAQFYSVHNSGEDRRFTVGALVIRVIPVPEEFFTPDGWWRSRQGQKIFLAEWEKTFANWIGI